VGQVTHDLLQTRFPKPLLEISAELNQHGVWEGELTHVCKNGKEIVVDSRWVLHRDITGRFTGTLEINRDITDRKQEEQVLRESEEHFHSLFQNLPIGFAYCQMYFENDRPEDFTYLEVNNAFETLTGLKNVAGKRVSEVVPGIRESNPEILESFGKTVLTGVPRGFETYVSALKSWYSISSYSPRRGYFVILFDAITERKRAEEAQRRLSAIVESSADAIFSKSLDGVIQSWNQGAERLYGYSTQEAVGKSVTILAPPGSEDEIPDILRRIVRGERLEHYETRRMRKDGRQIDVSLTVSPIRDPSGNIVGASTIARDITERKRAEEELLFKTALLEAQSETMIDGILVVGLTGEILLVNQQFASMWNIPEDAIRTKDDKRVIEHALMQVKDSSAFEERVKYLYSHEAEKSRDEIGLKDGRLFDRYSSPLQGSSGKLYGRIWYFRDITERKRLEDQFRQAQKMEAVGRLAAGVAHDFNNLLTVIIGYSNVMLEQFAIDDPMRAYTTEIQAAGERAVGLTRQLLAFSRQQVLAAQVLDLNTLIANITRMLKRLIGEDIDLVFNAEPSPATIKADPGQIEQVLMNLAVNSRDAMPRGGKLTIEITNLQVDEAYGTAHYSMPAGAYVTLAVSDTGCGMDKDTQAHIFEPFFTTKEQGKGTGLGLATVYGIVKQSEGYILVYSEPGAGTTFKIYLPSAKGAPQTAKRRVVPACGAETVLLVEDDAGLRELARMILVRRGGYKVLESTGGKEALVFAEQYKGTIHLLLTDVVMPGMSGRELSEELATLRPDLKILYMSGYTDDTVVRHGVLEEGMAFLQKPFSAESLLRKVRDVLDTRTQA
jgi:PAS domain S-box-containing protein